MGNISTNIFKEYPAENRCFSFWHKIRYGSYETKTNPTEKLHIVEYWCKKCKKKTGGYTHLGPFEVTL